MRKKNKLDGMYDLDLQCREMADLARSCIDEGGDVGKILRIVCGAEVYFALSLFAKQGKFEGYELKLDKKLNEYRMIIERER